MVGLWWGVDPVHEDSFKFDIVFDAIDGRIVVFLKRWTVYLSIIYVGYLVLIFERYLQMYDKKIIDIIMIEEKPTIFEFVVGCLL